MLRGETLWVDSMNMLRLQVPASSPPPPAQRGCVRCAELLALVQELEVRYGPVKVYNARLPSASATS